MTGLLFALAYWLVVGWAACGAVVLLGFVWLLVSDWFEELRGSGDERRVVAPLAASSVRVPPYDWNDPFEQWFLLPDAPDPKWLVG